MTGLLPLGPRRARVTNLERSGRSTWELIRSIILQETNLRAEAVKPDLKIATLNLDSIMVSAIECALEDEFGISIGPKAFDECVTLGDIEKLLTVRSA